MNSTVDLDEQTLKYPLGRYAPPSPIPASDVQAWITDLEALPSNLRGAVADFGEEQLDTPYRPGGWTVRQVIHHLPDSHINSYVRFRLALTEDSPVIKPYNESAWANLADAKTGPIEISLSLLDCLHARWTRLLHTLNEQDFARTMRHPESGELRLDWTVGLYAWHGRHHLAQIKALHQRMGW